MVNRLDQLLSFYEEDPNDPFNVYVLAIEYVKSDPEKAKKLFYKLLSEFPDYLATYYHAAKLYEEVGERDEALETYRKGIELARKQQNQKAQRELQSAYDELTFE